MKKALCTAAILLASNNSFAMNDSCWTADSMEGVAFLAGENYKQMMDKISSPVTIVFNGGDSIASYHDEPLMQIGDYMMIGVDHDGNHAGATFIYSIEPDKGKMLFTRIRQEPKLFAGVVTLVGDAKPCQ